MLSRSSVWVRAGALVAFTLAVAAGSAWALEDERLPRPGQPERAELQQPRGILDPAAPAGAASKGASSDVDKAGDKDADDDKDDDKDDKKREGLFGEPLHGRGGFSAEYIYTGDLLTNTRGGIHTGTSYRGLFELVLKADLEKMEVGPGGNLFFDFQQGHGRGFTEHYVGDAMWLSNIDWRDMTQVSEYWYEREFLDKKLAGRVGKIDCNSEFAVVDLGGDFINSAFGLAPIVPMPTFPNPSAGAMLMLKPNEKLDLKLGVWDGCPNGETWGFSGTGVTFTIAEAKCRWDLADANGLPGDFHAGMWYHNGPWQDLRFLPENAPFGGIPGGDPLRSFRYLSRGAMLPRHGDAGSSGNIRTVDGNHGVYLGADQLLWKEVDEEKDAQGLGAFVQYGWAPEEINWAQQYYGGGLVYRGLLPGRDEDTLGVGVAHLVFSNRLAQTEDETAIELFYLARVTKWMKLQPDMQYIVNPGGVHRDALVAGMRMEVVF